jgi:ribosomal protein L7/L12
MDLLTLAAIAIVALAVIAAVFMLRRSWGGSLRDLPPAAAQLSKPATQIAAQDLAEISALMVRGNKIEAIKRYRELSGVGLKEAKDYVEAMPLAAFQDLPAPAESASTPVDVSEHDLAEISALVARGNKIEAIKRYRGLSGVGLKEAKDYVEAMPADGHPPVLPRAGAVSTVDAGSLAEVHALALQGQKIEAIKRYRELTGVGLKEAKDYVDRL